MTYSQKLLDPRWQRRKTETQMKHRFECRECHSKTKTLNVHHKYYIPNTDPWDYCDDALTLLCVECHAKEETHKARYVATMRKVLEMGASYNDLNIMIRGFLPTEFNYNYGFEEKAKAAAFVAQFDHLTEKYMEERETTRRDVFNY